MKKLILSLVFLSAFTLRGSAQLQGLEVVKVRKHSSLIWANIFISPMWKDIKL